MCTRSFLASLFGDAWGGVEREVCVLMLSVLSRLTQLQYHTAWIIYMCTYVWPTNSPSLVAIHFPLETPIRPLGFQIRGIGRQLRTPSDSVMSEDELELLDLILVHLSVVRNSALPMIVQTFNLLKYHRIKARTSVSGDLLCP